jgi:hypothetical protein
MTHFCSIKECPETPSLSTDIHSSSKQRSHSKESLLSKHDSKNYVNVGSYFHRVCTEFDTHILFCILGHAIYKGYPEIKDTKQVGGERTSLLEGFTSSHSQPRPHSQ